MVLADQLKVSRPTLRRAIEYLVDRGYLVRRRAVGTQVVHPKVRRPVELTSLYDDLITSGKQPRRPCCRYGAGDRRGRPRPRPG